MKKKNGLGKAIVWGAAAAAAGVAAKKAYDNSKKKQEEKVDNVSDQVMENRSYEAVSYTHLDVYKRQIIYCTNHNKKLKNT